MVMLSRKTMMASGGGAWSPADIEGLVLWLDASDSTTLFQDAAGTIPATADGHPVGRWADKSGNAHHASQASADARPTLQLAERNDLPVVQFDGVNDLLSTDNVTLSAFTAFYVFRASGTAGLLSEQSDNAAQNPGHYLYGSTNATMTVWRGTAMSQKNYTANWSTDNRFRVLTHIFNGTHSSHLLYASGIALPLTNSVATQDPGTSDATAEINIGGRVGGVLPLTGQFGTIIFYNAALSDENRQKVEAYLVAKWNIAGGGAILIFDDARTSVYTEAFAYMQPLGLVGTVYVVSSWVGTEGYCTWEQLQEMDAAGWSIANHTATHVELSTLTEQEIVTELTTCKAALDAHGLTKASAHVAYPYGGTVNDTMRNAMLAAGMLTGRSTIDTSIDLASTGFYDVPVDCYVMRDDLLATVEAEIRAEWLKPNWSIALFHGISATPGQFDWSIDNFQDFIDWLVANNVTCATIADLYDLMVTQRA